jgi:hypothetical protein
MDQATCDACQASVWNALHEPTGRTLLLEWEPSLRGDFVAIQDSQGRVVVRSLYSRAGVSDGQTLFRAHICSEALQNVDFGGYVALPD